MSCASYYCIMTESRLSGNDWPMVHHMAQVCRLAGLDYEC